MPSPFPGMDPYLEPHWPDVHLALISEARRALNRVLPRGMVARAEKRVAVESGDELHRVGPDVRVFRPSTADPNEGAGGVVIEAPFKLVVELDPIVERYIRVIDTDGELVTVIEVISPTNKRQPGLQAFREKRFELLQAGVHFVEIDLVRAGDWRALMRPEVCPSEAVSTYRGVIRTALSRPAGYLFPIRLGEQLPVIPIPLRAGIQPVQLALQPLLDAVYDDGRYGETIDYSSPPDPPLQAEDAAWADELLRAAGWP